MSDLASGVLYGVGLGFALSLALVGLLEAWRDHREDLAEAREMEFPDDMRIARHSRETAQAETRRLIPKSVTDSGVNLVENGKRVKFKAEMVRPFLPPPRQADRD